MKCHGCGAPFKDALYGQFGWLWCFECWLNEVNRRSHEKEEAEKSKEEEDD